MEALRYIRTKILYLLVDGFITLISHLLEIVDEIRRTSELVYFSF